MLALRNPFEAYRSIEFDAQVAGSSSGDLVLFCIEDVSGAIGRAFWAKGNGNPKLCTACLQRAANGIAALQLGVDQGSPLAEGLLTLYSAMARCIAASMAGFDHDGLSRVRQDLDELSEHFRAGVTHSS